MPKKSKKKRTAKPKSKRKGGGGSWSFILSVIIAFGVGVTIMLMFGDNLFSPMEKGPTPPPPPATKEVRLYFSAKDGKSLSPEERTIKAGSLESQLTQTIEALIKGPLAASKDGDAKPNIIPQGTELRSIKVKGPVAYVDFTGEFLSNHPGGSSAELQTIYSVVNTLTLNFFEVKSVQLLVDGKTRETLAGHILIRIPLGPDTDMVEG